MNDLYSQEHENQREMRLNAAAKEHLGRAAKWARFIAIVGFVCSGLVAIAALSAGSWMAALSTSTYGTAYAGMPAGVLTGSYLIAGILYFFMALFLYRFAAKAKQALAQQDEDSLTDSLANLKNLFQLYGILLIIALIFIALAILIGIVGGIAAAF